MSATRLLSRLGLAVSALALIGADAPERERSPGMGVLCLGALLYISEIEARSCHAGKDPAWHERLVRYTERFDAYLIHNLSGGQADMTRFKENQGLTPETRADICKVGEEERLYDRFRKVPPQEMDKAVDDLLLRDGPPTFGDCL